MIAEKTNDDLSKDHDLRMKDHDQFLKNLMNINVRGDADGTLKKKALTILVEALNPDYDKRPTFIELHEILYDRQCYINEFQKVQKLLKKVTEERSIFCYIIRFFARAF